MALQKDEIETIYPTALSAVASSRSRAEQNLKMSRRVRLRSGELAYEIQPKCDGGQSQGAGKQAFLPLAPAL